jgi:hypothetical protein
MHCFQHNITTVTVKQEGSQRYAPAPPRLLNYLAVAFLSRTQSRQTKIPKLTACADCCRYGGAA